MHTHFGMMCSDMMSEISKYLSPFDLISIARSGVVMVKQSDFERRVSFCNFAISDWLGFYKMCPIKYRDINKNRVNQKKIQRRVWLIRTNLVLSSMDDVMLYVSAIWKNYNNFRLAHLQKITTNIEKFNQLIIDSICYFKFGQITTTSNIVQDFLNSNKCSKQIKDYISSVHNDFSMAPKPDSKHIQQCVFGGLYRSRKTGVIMGN